MGKPYRRDFALLAVLLTALPARAQAARPEGPCWPQFHGPKRDNISTDTGLLKEWPEAGPRLVWSFDGCGGGYSGVAIADGRIFTVGDFDDTEQLIALDLAGRLLWRAANGGAWTGPHPGSRTTPTYDHGVLYHLSPIGRLGAYTADSGKEVWAVDLVERFGARYGTWALAENLLVVDDKVICTPGGTKALMVALDKHTGRPVWINNELYQTAAYCSPVPATIHGVRQIVQVVQRSVIGVELETGRLLWSHPHITRHDQNVTMPVVHGDKVFATSGHLGGSEVVRIGADARSTESVWANQQLDNCHGGVLLLDGHLYGSACRSGGRGFFCVEFDTGEVRFTDSSLTKLSLTYADGMLYAVDQARHMYLIEPSTAGLKVVSQFDLPRGGEGLLFAHPVVCGGRLYVRHDRMLYVYDVRARAAHQETQAP